MIRFDFRQQRFPSKRVDFRKRLRLCRVVACRDGAAFEISEPLLRDQKQLGNPSTSLCPRVGFCIKLRGITSRRREILLGLHQLCSKLRRGRALGQLDPFPFLKACDLLVEELSAGLCFFPRTLVLFCLGLPALESSAQFLNLSVDLEQLRRGLTRTGVLDRRRYRAGLSHCRRSKKTNADGDGEPRGYASSTHRGFRFRIKPSCATEATSAPPRE